MKHLALYLMLLLALPATAQSGLFGSHSHHSHDSSEHHPHEPLIKAGRHAHSHHKEAGMNLRDFEDAVRIIKSENFDEKRLDAAKRIVAVNPMSSRQIADICRLFTFEANRLEFAKCAYFHCVDSNMYFMVDEVFTFNSSKEELHEHIRELRKKYHCK